MWGKVQVFFSYLLKSGLFVFFKNLVISIYSLIKMFLEPVALLPSKLPRLFNWFVITFIVGSSTMWIPYIILFFKNEDPSDFLLNGNMMAFFVLVIAERISVLVSTPGKADKDNSAIIRGIAVTLSLILILVCNSVYVSKTLFSISTNDYYQWIIVALGMLVALYLFCLTDTPWETVVNSSSYAEEEEVEVQDLNNKSKRKTKSSKGIEI
jgi:hypothetical protein